MTTPDDIREMKVIARTYIPKHVFQSSLVKCQYEPTSRRTCLYKCQDIIITRITIPSDETICGNPTLKINLEVFEKEKLIHKENFLWELCEEWY